MNTLESGHPEDPIHLFCEWHLAAKSAGWRRKWLSKIYPPIVLHQPDAMVLATIGADGFPASRLVLLKEVSLGGFVFYTNYLSRKAKEIEANPRVSLVFQWSQPDRQVRVEGIASRVTAKESDEYWMTRPRGSQIASAASLQSSEIASRHELEQSVARIEAQYGGVPSIPRPSHWGGYRVMPHLIEFWEARVFRLHDRIEFTRQYAAQTGGPADPCDGIWKSRRLSP